MYEQGQKVLKLLVVFMCCWMPNLISNLIFITLAYGRIAMDLLTAVKLTIFHSVTQAIFITELKNQAGFDTFAIEMYENATFVL